MSHESIWRPLKIAKNQPGKKEKSRHSFPQLGPTACEFSRNLPLFRPGQPGFGQICLIWGQFNRVLFPIRPIIRIILHFFKDTHGEVQTSHFLSGRGRGLKSPWIASRVAHSEKNPNFLPILPQDYLTTALMVAERPSHLPA